MRPLAASLLLALSACSGGPPNETCDNGKDDNGNGKTDCEDDACTAQPVCAPDAGYWGACAKCGVACTKQQQCFGPNLLDDRPMPVCGPQGKCQVLNTDVQLRIEYNTSTWGGVMASALGAVTTRWVSKTGLDGGAVTCAAITAAAPSATAPTQLEASGLLNELGFDTTKVNVSGGIPNPLIIPFVHTASGSDYVIFTEAWSGGIDATTHLPNGMRRSAGCVDTGVDVGPITVADDCARDGGTCRTLHLPLPAP